MLSQWIAPTPVETFMRAHLDKARSFDAANPKLGDLGSAIDAWRSHASAMSVESIVERARAQALAMLAAGTTAIRSHVDVLEDGGAGLEASIETWASVFLDVQAAAYMGHDRSQGGWTGGVGGDYVPFGNVQGVLGVAVHFGD